VCRDEIQEGPKLKIINEQTDRAKISALLGGDKFIYFLQDFNMVKRQSRPQTTKGVQFSY
jgi:hypothetical protein